MNKLQTKEEVEQKFNNGINVLRELEKIMKALPTDFDTHSVRLNWIKFLSVRLDELRQLEQSQFTEQF